MPNFGVIGKSVTANHSVNEIFPIAAPSFDCPSQVFVIYFWNAYKESDELIQNERSKFLLLVMGVSLSTN